MGTMLGSTQKTAYLHVPVGFSFPRWILCPNLEGLGFGFGELAFGQRRGTWAYFLKVLPPPPHPAKRGNDLRNVSPCCEHIGVHIPNTGESDGKDT